MNQIGRGSKKLRVLLMEHVFVLYHLHELPSGIVDEKLIGWYETRELAEAAMERVKGAEGFRDCPEGFVIKACKLDEDHWDGLWASWPALDESQLQPERSARKSVFVLSFLRELPDEDHDFERMIGVYSTRQAAEAALERAKARPEFQDAHLLDEWQAFFLGESKLGEEAWAEGYFTWLPEEQPDWKPEPEDKK